MKTILHKANERGHANHGWLDSYHSFSFAGYYDPGKIQFGALRVLNDDTVEGGRGFGQHPHENMEIVSIPLSGDLKHEDSTGRKEVIRQHDVQIMSAGSGIAHSEMNANSDQAVRFLQIWIFPKEQNIRPRYDQKTFRPEDRVNRFQTVVAPDDNNAVYIHQDAWLSLGKFNEEREISYRIHKDGNGVYAFVLEGEATINGSAVQRRDALGIWEAEEIILKAMPGAELLLIEVPMDVNKR